MTYSVPDICDEFPQDVSVLEPLFSNFGGKQRFSGEIITIKCFEDNSPLFLPCIIVFRSCERQML